MSIDKSIKQNYAIQGKVKNYLGKQKMVKAPKKWKSAPDHPDTELAYITKAEKDALIKMNLYGSMNGKANKGPSGIISLNGWGDSDRGYDGGNDTDTGGSGDDYNYTPAPAPAPSVSFHEDDFINTTPTQTFDNGEDQEEDVARMMLDMGLTPDNAPTGFQNTTGEDGLGGGDYVDPGTSLYNAPPNYISDDDDKALSYVNWNQPEIEKKGFWDSGIGSGLKTVGRGLKNVAKVALPFVAAPLAGLVAGQKGYQLASLGMKGKRAFDFANKFSKGKVGDVVQKAFQPGSGGKGPPTVFNDSDNNEGNALVANNVIAKSVQEYSPAQVKSLQNNINLLSSVMKNGQYQGKQLNKSQITQIASKRSELQNQYDMIKGSLV